MIFYIFKKLVSFFARCLMALIALSVSVIPEKVLSGIDQKRKLSVPSVRYRLVIGNWAFLLTISGSVRSVLVCPLSAMRLMVDPDSSSMGTTEKATSRRRRAVSSLLDPADQELPWQAPELSSSSSEDER